MANKLNYKYFKVYTVVTENNSSVIDLMYDNLKYRDALKQFKIVRESLELHTHNDIVLILSGIIESGDEKIIREKHFSLNQVVRDAVTSTCDNFDLQNESLNCEDDAFSEISEEDYSQFMDSNGDSDFVSIEDLLSDTTIFNSKEFYDNINDHINDSELKDVTLRDYENSQLGCDTKKDTCENNLISKDVASEEVTYKDIADSTSFTEKTLKDLCLSDYYKHIGDIDTPDLVKLLIDVLLLLDKKHKHNIDMVNLLEKMRDCCYHDFENFDESDFVSKQSQDSYLSSLGKKMHDISVKRRKAKDGCQLTEKVLNNISKVRLSNYNPLTSINLTKHPFDIKVAHNIKVHSFKYSTEAERLLLMTTLPHTFDKVIDVTWGTIQCYNKVGSEKAKKLNSVSDINSKLKIDILDSVSLKKYDSIIDETVPFGKSFLKGRGTSVKLTNMNIKNIKNLIHTIHNKYSKFAYHSDTESFYLIDRL